MSIQSLPRETQAAPATAIIRDDAQALDTARALAETLKEQSALRDRERRLPRIELEQFSRSGLWGISVPQTFGGAGVSSVTLAEVIRIISAADGSLGQIPQNHFYALEVLRVNGSPEQQKRLYAEVLAGQRFGNALAELGTKTAHDRTTRLSRDGHGWRINGRKFYSTGALYAQRIPTSVIDDDGIQQLAFVPANAAGLSVIDDWSGFGQRTTGSGSVVFENVYVDADDVVPFQTAFERPTTVGPLAQILHAAIDTGIARAAYEDALHFVRTAHGHGSIQVWKRPSMTR
jgi:alkylation response protein AidB-like acyl-CoA dehydrogenase